MNFDYNTKRTDLIIPDYGRNIQKMIDYAVTIDDREKRNRVTLSIISAMGDINPQLKNIDNFKHILWDHLIIMSNFKLDINNPYKYPTREKLLEKPDRIKYNTNEMRYRNYGITLKRMIKELMKIEDTKEKTVLLTLIANHVKKINLLWNNDIVSDNFVFNEIEKISDFKLKVDRSISLVKDDELINFNKNKNRSSNKNKKRK